MMKFWRVKEVISPGLTNIDLELEEFMNKHEPFLPTGRDKLAFKQREKTMGQMK